MKVTSIHAHSFSDFKRRNASDMDADVEAVTVDEGFKKDYYSFTCLLRDDVHNKIFCGTTNFSLNLLQTFDPVTGEFESMKYYDFSDDFFEVKIHRSLAMGKDGLIYGATSTLHPEKKRMEAPGGKIFRFDYEKRNFELLGIPKEHDYVQTITLDPEREMIYGFTYPVFEFFAFSIPEREVKYIQYMGSIPHLSALDDDGGYWATWGSNKHAFFRYDPGSNTVKFYDHGFPTKCRNLMYHNAGPIDMALNIGDGGIYMASEQADLYKFDPKTIELKYLGKPFPDVRLPGLCIGPGGYMYCAGGTDRKAALAAYDLQTGAFHSLGFIKDSESGVPCFRVHDMVASGNTLYIGETDHLDRSNYLWEVNIEL